MVTMTFLPSFPFQQLTCAEVNVKQVVYAWQIRPNRRRFRNPRDWSKCNWVSEYGWVETATRSM